MASKKWFKKKKASMLTVKQLKALLETFDETSYIGTIGHFGEFLSIDSSDFYETTVDLSEYWRDTTTEKIKVIDISCPDKGPEPD